MSYDNDDDVEESLILALANIKTDYASNVFYGPKTKANAKKVKDREAFYAWVKGLSPLAYSSDSNCYV